LRRSLTSRGIGGNDGEGSWEKETFILCKLSYSKNLI